VRKLILCLLPALLAGTAFAETPFSCDSCATWNTTQTPFRLYGNAYYVGPHGLSSVLITSKEGHILIDGAVPESAPKIAASIRELGFKVEDIKLILNTHVHFDHAGGIAELQKLSGAKVAASASSAKVLQSGAPGKDDPQFGTLPPISRVSNVRVFKDGETLHVGALAVTAHSTPGHTPGGTTWSWTSCEGKRCLNMVYADSLTPVSAPGFRFVPNVLPSFEKSYATLSALPCDVLLTAHPDVTDLWARLDKREKAHDPDGLVDAKACLKYVEASRERLNKRIAEEKAAP